MQRLSTLAPAMGRALLVMSCMCVLIAPAMAGQPQPDRTAPAPDGERVEALRAFLEAQTVPGRYTGAVSLIAVDGRIVERRAYGAADLARTKPMHPDAIFRIYSMTKPITSVAALMLAEQGKLDLDDPVSRFLPEFADLQCRCAVEHPRPTLRHLLTHTAGFATHPENADAAERLRAAAPDGAATLAEYAHRVAQAPLAEAPGTHFHYDGVNTQVLARVIEVASGQSLEAFLRERIFVPLRMRDTGFEVPVATRTRVVDLTTVRDGALALADTASAREPGSRLSRYDNGAGGLYSTLDDYYRFAQMLANGGELEGVRLLSARSVDEMMSDQLPRLSPSLEGAGRGEGFGLGGYVVTDVALRGRLGSIGQFGWSGSASTYFTVDRSRKLVAILMAQHLPGDDPSELPRLSVPFFNHVYQTLP